MMLTISISRVKMTPPPAARHNPWHESRKGFLLQMVQMVAGSLYGSTFSRTVWRLYGGAKGRVVWY
jgi:hypothetical protein